jgi:hypothetical protein
MKNPYLTKLVEQLTGIGCLIILAAMAMVLIPAITVWCIAAEWWTQSFYRTRDKSLE